MKKLLGLIIFLAATAPSLFAQKYGIYKIDATPNICVNFFNTNGESADPTGTPTLDIYEEDTATEIIDNQSLTKFDAKDGLFCFKPTLSAANGFEVTKQYHALVTCDAGNSCNTDGRVVTAVEVQIFQIQPSVNVDAIATDAITAGAIAASAIGASEIAADAIGASEIATGALAADAFVAGAIDAAALAADAGTEIGTAVWATTTRQLTGTQTFNLTGSITGSLSGSVGSVTGAVGSVTAVSAGAITAASFGSGAIDAAAIAANAIGASELADSAIDAGAIATDAITSAKIADGAIDAGSLAADAITAAKIAAGAITSSEAPNLDAAITSRMASYTQPTGFLAATFPSGTIANTTNITAGTITTASAIGNGGIVAATFGAGAIDATAIAANAIGSSELATTGVDEIVDGVWDEAQAGHVTAGTFGLYLDSAISGVSTGGVSVADIADAVWDELRADHVGAGSFGEGVASVQGDVTGNVDGSVASIATGGIAAASFAAGAIDASAIAADAIGASELAANAIAASEIADGAIDVGAIADDAITANKLAANAIGSSEFGATDEVVDGVWDEAQSGHTTAGTFGKFLDVEVSSVSSGGLTAAAIADAVWDEAIAGHLSAGSTGLRLSRVPDAAAGANGGLPTVNASNYVAGIQGTLNTLDGLDTAQDTQHSTTQSAVSSVSSEIAAVSALVSAIPTKVVYRPKNVAATGIVLTPYDATGAIIKTAANMACEGSLDGAAFAPLSSPNYEEHEATAGAYWTFSLVQAETNGKLNYILCSADNMVTTPIWVEFQN